MSLTPPFPSFGFAESSAPCCSLFVFLSVLLSFDCVVEVVVLLLSVTGVSFFASSAIGVSGLLSFCGAVLEKREVRTTRGASTARAQI